MNEKEIRQSVGYLVFRYVMEVLLETVCCFVFLITTVATICLFSILIGEAYSKPEILENGILVIVLIICILLNSFIVYLEKDVFEFTMKFKRTQNDILLFTNCIICLFGTWFIDLYRDMQLNFRIDYANITALVIDVVIGNALFIAGWLYYLLLKKAKKKAKKKRY